jgi:hypothetical protein
MCYERVDAVETNYVDSVVQIKQQSYSVHIYFRLKCNLLSSHTTSCVNTMRNSDIQWNNFIKIDNT